MTGTEHSLHWRKSTNKKEGKQNRNSDAAFETNFQLVIAFIEASRIFVFVFLVTKACNINRACTETTHSILLASQKNIHLMTQSL
jgi:hypothetical protein